MAAPKRPRGNAGKGRPKGAPNRVTRELKAFANEYTERAVKALAAVMDDPDAPASARVQAAIALLDRAHGRPQQQVVNLTSAMSHEEALSALE